MLTSIKAKIIIFHASVLAVVLSVLGVFLYFSLNKIVFDSIDSSLATKAKAVATLISGDSEDKTEFRFSDEVMWEYSSTHAKSFFQIRRLDGTTLEKSDSLKDAELPYAGNETRTNFKTISINGHISRMINFYVHDGLSKSDRSGRRDVVIQCAEDIGDKLELLEDFRSVLLGAVILVMLLSASGGFLIARKALAPVRDISQTIDGISEHDLSKRVSLENIPPELRILAKSFNRTFGRVEEAFNRQKRFTADASHELRTPLSVVMSQSEIALRKDRTTEVYKGSLSVVLHAARSMSSIVRKLLTLARLDSHSIELKMEPVDLKEIVNDAAELLTPLAKDKGVHIHKKLSEPLLIQGDQERLLELFTNLLDNAVKYNVPGGEIHIDTRKEAGFMICEVKDTGIGIPDGSLDKVFDRFYRVDQAHSKKIEGSGLGLSICREIATLHGGRIEIRSREGEGTVISVYLKVEVPSDEA